MLLNNLNTVPEEKNVDILIDGGAITSIGESKNSLVKGGQVSNIKFENAIVFPGLINSHDHLDYNSFPQLGNKVYNNYVEWGDDIHKENKDTINKVLKIPKELRTKWGIYKNLLCGVTTVVNHGPKVQAGNNLITVWQQCHTLHSIKLEKKWKVKLNLPLIKKQPFVIHIGEGTDNPSKEEINELIKWNLFKRDLIGIHGVAMDEEQADKFKAIVWCPDSNHFLLEKTAAIDKLKHKTKILFGTDSSVSANWNLWEHMRLARKEKIASDKELFDMLTIAAADTWNMAGCGMLANNYSADIVVARKKAGLNSMDSFFVTNPEDILMVMSKGQVTLFDAEVLPQLSKEGISIKDFSKISINGISKYVLGDLPGLIKSIREYYPEAAFPVTF